MVFLSFYIFLPVAALVSPDGGVYSFLDSSLNYCVGIQSSLGCFLDHRGAVRMK